MQIRPLHAWNLDLKQAAALQQRLAEKIRLAPLQRPPQRIAGADVSYARRGGQAFAAVVVMSFPELQMLEHQQTQIGLTLPYIPGYLTFREGPAILKAFERVQVRPDVVLFDGQGMAHPRRLGLAAHLGLWLGLPSIGCAKTRLSGEHAPVGDQKGAVSPLVVQGREIGAVVRTRTGVKPVFVSPGHLITVAESVQLVLQTSTRYRLPEPLRQAHVLANTARRKVER